MIKNNKLGGTDWGNEKLLYPDLNDTFDRTIRGGIALTAITSGTAENNSIFLDSGDNAIKQKDNNGDVYALKNISNQTSYEYGISDNIGTSYADVNDMSITVSEAGTYLILMKMQGYQYDSGDDNRMGMRWKILNNATTLCQGRHRIQVDTDALEEYWYMMSDHTIATLAVNDVVKVQAEANVSHSSDKIYDRRLTLIRLEG